MPKVVFVKDSSIGEWDYGKFRGHVTRKERRPERWNPSLQTMDPVVPEHWQVAVYGVNNAWREYKLPIKRGNTRSTVVVQACEHARFPENIDTVEDTYDGHPIYGSFVSLLDVQQKE